MDKPRHAFARARIHDVARALNIDVNELAPVACHRHLRGQVHHGVMPRDRPLHRNRIRDVAQHLTAVTRRCALKGGDDMATAG
jgi:hypothetical protein